MPLICHCPSCKAKYQLGDQYAGRTIKCPKCSAAIAVPAANAAAGGEPAASAPVKASPTTPIKTTPAKTAPAVKPALPLARAARIVDDPSSKSAVKIPIAAKPAAADAKIESSSKIASKAAPVVPDDADTDDASSKSAPSGDDLFSFLEETAPAAKKTSFSEQVKV